jgi:phosphoglycerate dehydrogenase-like enzyme
LIKVALEPTQPEQFVMAIEKAGATVSQLDSGVHALVWTDYWQPNLLRETLEANPQLQWVQLPFAGVDAFQELLKMPITFTSAKGAYREPVAEHVLTLCLALGRKIPERAKATSWGDKFAVSLYESHVLVIGGGGITSEFLKQLQPFGTEVTVISKSGDALAGATRTLPFNHLDEWLPKADFVVLAAALTDETRGVIDAERLSLMKQSAYLVNVARGAHVVTSDLILALNSGVIAGAALDVTDPEPLPDGHPLWTTKNCLITPHTADTPSQVTRLLAERIEANTKAFIESKDWVGLVDPKLGY